MDLFARMLKLSSEGYACAQIMMILVLEREGKEDPDIIRTIGALNNGLRDCGLICGAFTGGCCVISYFAGKGEADEIADPSYDEITQEFYTWFTGHVNGLYGGGSECPAILEGDNANKIARCPVVVQDSFNKVIELLDEHELL
jgi:hypothetical protein